MSLINIQDLTFGYDGNTENVFENVSLQIDTLWKLGLTGRNGRGKTTLLRLLAGELEYTGRILASADLEYFPRFPKNAYYAEEVILETAPDAEQWQMKRELALLDADGDLLYRPFDTLSNGEQTKILIAGMFLKENSFLLIDEPTNHLDIHARDVLADYLKRKKGFILVSHDRDFLDRCIDHVMAINKMNIEIRKGNFSTWNENRERQEKYEQVQNDRLKKEIHQLKQSAARVKAHADKIDASKVGFDPRKEDKVKGRRPSMAAKAAKLSARVKSAEKRIEKDISDKNELLRNTEDISELKLSPLKYHSSRLITFRDVSFGYEGRNIFSGLSFTAEQGDRIAVCGQNGCGKTTLLKIILGEICGFGGTVTVGSRLKISYVPQSAEGLCGSLDGYIESYDVNTVLCKAILRKLDFPRELLAMPMESYSQGQRKKVMIARSLSEQAHLYVWDEPLNYIDVLSRIQIEELLKNSDASIIFVEHDKRFCEETATRKILLDGKESCQR